MKFLLVLDPEEVGQLPDSLRQQVAQYFVPGQQVAPAAPQPLAEAAPAAEGGKRGRKPKAKPEATADLTAVVQNAPTEGPVFGGQMLPTQRLSPETTAAADQMYQQPIQQQPMQQFAPGTHGLPPAQPSKAPVIQGNTMSFPPSMGHHTQQNMAVDVLTQQPVPVQAQQAPFMPQMQGAPVNPVQPFAPPQQPVQSPQISAAQVRQMSVQIMTQPNGQQIMQNALSRAGLSTFSQVNDQNAPAVGYYLQMGMTGHG